VIKGKWYKSSYPFESKENTWIFCIVDFIFVSGWQQFMSLFHLDLTFG